MPPGEGLVKHCYCYYDVYYYQHLNQVLVFDSLPQLFWAIDGLVTDGAIRWGGVGLDAHQSNNYHRIIPTIDEELRRATSPLETS